MISANGVVTFVKEHTSSFGGEKDLGISSLFIYLLNDDNVKATKYVFPLFPTTSHGMSC